MNSAEIIRNAVTGVTALRASATRDPALLQAVREVKRFQASRFTSTYADLLQASRFRGAARFFLDELYGDNDYASRDTQFARIAGALQTLFPQQVIATAVKLAKLHALTEDLDHQMGRAWLALAQVVQPLPAISYVEAWRSVGRQDGRNAQLTGVLEIGHELDRLTRMPGLRMMLRMMRRPARAAGLSSLQAFLESGFETFAAMGGQGAGATEFLGIISKRESALIATLFSAELVTCMTMLRQGEDAA